MAPISSISEYLRQQEDHGHSDDVYQIYDASPQLDLELKELSKADTAVWTISGFRPHSSSISASTSSTSLSSLSVVSSSPCPAPRRVSLISSLQGILHNNAGPLLVAASQFFSTVMLVTTRLLENTSSPLSASQVLFYRMSFTTIGCLAWGWWTGTQHFPWGKKGQRWWLFGRSFGGFWGIFGLFYGLKYLPTSDAIVITFLAPSLTSYLYSLFLHEPFTRNARYASLVSLVGVLLIARPISFVSSAHASSTIPPNHLPSRRSSESLDIPSATIAERHLAIFFLLVSVLGGAVSILSIRALGESTHPLIPITGYSFLCTIFTFFTIVIFPTFLPPEVSSSPSPSSSSSPKLASGIGLALPDSSRQCGLLVLIIVCGFITQYLLTLGISKGKNGGKTVNMLYTSLVYGMVMGKVVFGEEPDGWSWAGMACILGGVIWVARESDVLTIEGSEAGRDIEEMGGLLGAYEQAQEERI